MSANAVGMGSPSNNGQPALSPWAMPGPRSGVSEGGGPAGANVFACLVHEAPDCVADLVANLVHLDPDSTVLLYDGSGGALLGDLFRLAGPGVVVHPEPRAMVWGKLHDFAVDCMRWALQRPAFATLTIVDSDQLALRAGYSAFLAAFVAQHPRAGCLVSAAGPQPRTTRIGPAQAAWRELELWQPFLARFADGEAQFPHWTFWPATVFTRAAAADLVALWDDEQLQDILAKSAIWASEEVVLPTLVALLGHQVLPSPCAYDVVRYRVSYRTADLAAATARAAVFWVHPVARSYSDPLRCWVRAHFGDYLPSTVRPPAPEPFAAPPGRPLLLLRALLGRSETIEGWLSAGEADLLAAAAVHAIAARPGPRTIVEVGSYCGRATVVLAGIAAALSPGSTVHAVDPHDGRLGVWAAPVPGVADSAACLRAHLEAADLVSAVEHHRGYAGEITLSGPIDVLLIDHLHDYASVAADFSQFHDELVGGALVVFHDYCDSFPGVVAFVDHLLATGAYTAVQRVESLTVIRKTGVLDVVPLSAVLAGAGSGEERDGLALLALTAAQALAGAGGRIVVAGRPTPGEQRVLAAVARAVGGQDAEAPVRLLLLGGEGGCGADIGQVCGGPPGLAPGAYLVVRVGADDALAVVARQRALVAAGCALVREMAGLQVWRAGAAAQPGRDAPDDVAQGVEEPVKPDAAHGIGHLSAAAISGPAGDPLVSCVMPTCDRRVFADRAIRYFLAQDYPHRELIVVDDGADPIADLIPADPRVRYVRLPERKTIGAKRNVGAEHARGELVVHWDDDDWSAPHRLSYQVQMFDGQDVDVSGLRAVLFCDPVAQRAWRYEYPAARRAWVHDATFCYRRRLWEQTPFPDTNFGIDTTYLWQGPSKTVGALPDSSFYVALVHPGNTSRKNVHDAWWHPVPVAQIAALMGDEWTHWAPNLLVANT